MVSCEKDLPDTENYQNNNWATAQMRTLDSDSIDYYLDIFAQTVAVGLTDNNFKNFVEERVKSEQGGNSSFLLIQNIDSLIGELTLYQFLAQKSQLTNDSRNTTFFSNELLELIPNLAISVYPGESISDIANWSFSSSISDPPVMPVTEIYNDTSETQNTAYFSDLTTTSLSNQTDPTNTVVVVQADPFFVPVNINTLEPLREYPIYENLLSLCQDLLQLIFDEIALLGSTPPVLIEGNFIPIPKLNPDFIVVLININNLIEVYNEECDEDFPWPPEEEEECDRDSRECREMISFFTVKHKDVINKFCKWRFSGRTCIIEVHQSFITLDDQGNPLLSNPPTRFVAVKRAGLINYPFPPVMLETYRWRYLEGIHGDLYGYNFIGRHHDAGAEKTFSLGFGTKLIKFLGIIDEFTVNTSYSVKRTIRDYDLGGEIIEYCDDADYPGRFYDNGLIALRVMEVEDCD